MADKKLVIEVDSNAEQAVTQFVALRKQVKDATVAFQAAQAQFGEFSKEAVKAGQKLAALKETMADSQATANAFKPGGGFKALADAGSLAASSIGAMTGAMQLMGSEGKDLEKTLVNIQSAMAIADALSRYDDMVDTFNNIKASARAAFTAIREGIGSTGIGLLVIALGAIVVYWDDITKALGKATVAQKAYNDSVEEGTKAMAAEIAKVSEVNQAFRDANKGVISRKDALEKYNTTFGETLGKTNSFNEAEKRMKESTGDYIKSVGLRAQALALYGVAAQKSANITTLQAGFWDKTVAAFRGKLGQGEKITMLEIELRAAPTEEARARIKKQLDEAKKVRDEEVQKVVNENKAEMQKEVDEINKMADQLMTKSAALTSNIGASTKNAAYDAAAEAAKLSKQTREQEAAAQKSEAERIYNEAVEFIKQRNQSDEDRIKEKYLRERAIIRAEYGKNSEQEKALTRAYNTEIYELYRERYEALQKLEDEKKVKEAQDRQDEINAYTAFLDFIVQAEIDAVKKILQERRTLAEGKRELLDIELNNVKNGFAVLASIDKKAKVLQAAAIIADNAVGVAKVIINTKAANAAAKVKYALIPGGEAIAASIASANNVSAGISIAAMAVSTYKALAALKEGGSATTGGNTGEGGSAAQFNIVGASGTNQLAAQIAAQQQQPVNAYVVGSDVSTQQSLDRNRITTATFL